MAKKYNTFGDEVLEELPAKAVTVAKETDSGDRPAVTTPTTAYSSRSDRHAYVSPTTDTDTDDLGNTYNVEVDHTDYGYTDDNNDESVAAAPLWDGKQNVTDWLLNAKTAGYTPLTEQQKRDMRKKEARDRLIGSISDAISALSNMYFTTKDAPSDKYSSLSDKMRERHEKAWKAYEDNEKQYINTALRIAREKSLEENRKRLAAIKERNQQWKEEDAKRKADDKAAESVRKAEQKREELGIKRDKTNSDIDLNNARKRKLTMGGGSSGGSSRRGGKGKRKGGGKQSSGSTVTSHRNGNTSGGGPRRKK